MNKLRCVFLTTICLLTIGSATELEPTPKATLEATKRKQRERLDRLKPIAETLLAHDLETLQLAIHLKVLQTYSGASIIATPDRPKFLGIISSSIETDSIFNPVGGFGSEYSGDSIWNKYGAYGSAHSSISPFNPHSSSPPVILKDRKVIGYLTKNKYLEGAVDPDWLKTFFD